MLSLQFCIIKTRTMEKHTITINSTEYTLYKNYQDHEALRMKFNSMTRHFWGFDFENFYRSTFWDNSCQLYSLFFDGEIVAHTTVSLFKTHLYSEEMSLAQIGTVMTAENFQKQGLARFLMEYIQAELTDQVDGMFLFANDTLTDFYPKFGFVPVEEYQATLSGPFKNTATTVAKLQLDDPADLELLKTYVAQSIPTAGLNTHNKGLSFFYLYAYPEFGYKQSIYYISSLKTIVVAEIEESFLTLVQLFQLESCPIENVINALAETPIASVRFGFTPLEHNTTFAPYKEDDLTLFVSANLAAAFDKHPLMVPQLSHT